MITTGTQVKHVNYGKGKVVKVENILYKIDFGSRGIIDISKRTADEVLELIEEEEHTETETYGLSQIEKVLIKVLDKYSGLSEIVDLGSKWMGGKLILQPGDPSLKSKEIPVETFFHKIVMVRDRLRVLEQNINSNSKLNDEEKLNLQQYITKVYGSLTSFNVLFRSADDYFVGEKKD
jgi:hypothetical protein